jgi:hypothetical protein
MALNPRTLAQRVTAAYSLAGLTQEQLGVLMERDGFGKYDPSRIVRAGLPNPPAKPPPEMTQGRAESISRHTGVPAEWFFEPDLNKLFGKESEVTRAEFLDLTRAVLELGESPTSVKLAELLPQLDPTASPEHPKPPEEPGS